MNVKFEEKNNVLSVFIDGKIYKKLLKEKSQKYHYLLEAENNYIINKLDGISSEEFTEGLEIYDFYDSNNFDKLRWVELHKENGILSTQCSICFEFENWQSPFRVSSLVNLYKLRFEELGFKAEIRDEEYEIDLDVSFEIESDSILGSIEKFSMLAKNEFVKIDNDLTKESASNLITKIFRFPTGYEAICSQYLLWFGEVLNNLNIDANVSTENKCGNTFLTIDSNGSNELKKEIEKAFYLYLSLPYSEFIPAESESSDIETKIVFQSLKNQVVFFNQQIEAKNSIIELKSLTNDTLKLELEAVKGKLLLLESMQNSKFEMFDGSVSFEKIKFGPFSINPKQLLDYIVKRKDV